MSSEFGELVNLDQLHYALVTADIADAYTTGVVNYLAPGGEIQHEAKADINTRYYNGVAMFTSVTEGATNVKITVSGVPMKLAALLTGKPYDSTHGIMIDTGDASSTPDCALSGRMELGDGGFRYFQYLKGKFSVGAQTATTRKDKTTEKTVDLTYTALATAFQFIMPDSSTKGVKGMFADTTDTAFTSDLQSAWFAQTQTPALLGAVTALALSTSVPAANAATVVVTSAITLTFSNAIASDKIIVMKASDNTVVACTKAYNATGKILTITPSASLTAAAIYYVVVDGVTDIYGQVLTPVINKFTCA